VQFEDRLKNILSIVPQNVKQMAEQRLSEAEGQLLLHFAWNAGFVFRQ
jgi:hypothetical protein